jgi:hypothetical protein
MLDVSGHVMPHLYHLPLKRKFIYLASNAHRIQTSMQDLLFASIPLPPHTSAD